MDTKKRVVPAATAAVLGLAAAMQPAAAGHFNVLAEAELSGRHEVPADGSRRNVGDRNGRGEAYVFGIDNDPLTLCYILQAERIDELDQLPGNGRAAHIHEGAAGSNGPVVANLAWPTDGQAADCLTEGEEGKFPTGESGIVGRILANPENFYINVHNNAFPGGAIRGQLEDTGHDHGESAQ